MPCCLPLKIRRIKKQLGTKNLKIQGEILKARRGLIQVQKHQEKKIHRNSQKLNLIKSKIRHIVTP
jgi:hypothetical protein